MTVRKLPTKLELIQQVKQVGVAAVVREYKKTDVYQGSEESLDYLFTLIEGYKNGIYS